MAAALARPGRMRLTVNGESREAAEGQTVLELVQALGLPSERLAVERNRELVPRRNWPTTRLATGDHIEIVHFVGGG
ncbi:MAG: sulfur carrier protein ThiS [Terriglobales bacterium]